MGVRFTLRFCLSDPGVDGQVMKFMVRRGAWLPVRWPGETKVADMLK
jgi:hypothetical protein